jgi:hypothetical protein
MASALRLRVDLMGTPEPVWRRLVVPTVASLADLKEALVVAFGWHDSHLSGFWTDGPWRGSSYVSRAQIEDLDVDGEPTDGVAAGDVLQRVGDQLHWIYDYGDDWHHRIRVEALVEYPGNRIHCTGGRNAAPPEDCGGPMGYQLLLDALADPGHPEHDELREWLGAPFDPTSFDTAAVDRILGTIPLQGVTHPSH